jgi:hypothetical protein
MKRFLSAVLILALVCAVSQAASRTWKSSNGRFSIEAELIDVKDGKAQLKKSDGKVIEVPLGSLCDEDRRYVKKQFPGVEEEKLAPGAEYREWKTKNGKFTTVAEFLGCEGGKVQLRKPDGSELAVDKKLLSTADQAWVAAELKRRNEEDKEAPSTDKGGDTEIAGKIDSGDIPMKLVRLDAPKAKARGRTSPASYLLTQIEPQRFFVKLGKSDDGNEVAFHRVVKQEPSYTSQTPIRGVARFGSQEYGFAFDMVGKASGYNKLYFDLDGNGDLTDDKPVTAISAVSVGPGLSQSQFPRVDLKLDVKGRTVECSFLPSLLCRGNQGDAYATVTLYSAAVREGSITQGKKRTKLMLLDHNSNGVFDDAVSVRPDGSVAEGDLLLINPSPKKQGGIGGDRNFVNKVVCVGREFYRMEISTSGDSLKLTPTKLSMGCVTNSSLAYSAMLSSPEFGVVMVSGAKDQKISLPEGEWKVLSYSIEAPALKTLLAATFGGDAPSTTVKKGTTAKLPFGAPLRAVVTAARGQGNNVALSLSILGVGGERCTNLIVNGNRPPKPKFVIKDKDGKTVHQGVFEWG